MIEEKKTKETDNNVSRETLLLALYGATSKKDLLSKFEESLQVGRMKKSEKYTHLLEQIIYFSHAIIYDHSIQTAHNYRQSFMTVAKESKSLKMDDAEVERAFSFLNRTERKTITSTREPKEDKAEDTIKDKCEAKEAIISLKKQLDDKSYTLTRGQKKEDKEIYIKVALVVLSTGESLKTIMESLEIDRKRLVLELENKTAKGYIEDIRTHYEDKKGTDYPRAIRKAIKNMNIANCINLNGLSDLHKECIIKN